jgi:hypothetical protein
MKKAVSLDSELASGNGYPLRLGKNPDRSRMVFRDTSTAVVGMVLPIAVYEARATKANRIKFTEQGR